MTNKLSESKGGLSQKPDNGEVPMPLQLQSHKYNPVYFFYEQLDHSPNGEPVTRKMWYSTNAPTAEEINIAAGRVQLSFQEANSYVTDLEKKTADIVDALRCQAELANGKDFDQDKFEELLAEWIVLCDQPFDEVDKQPFRRLLEYVHRPSGKTLKIPHCTAI
ncbi:hypothetical protein H0H92_008436 [Tricholoma furcatifolium]|nr:hypothetical protein H0H92_008436 [Tricholoma furcatifolium]